MRRRTIIGLIGVVLVLFLAISALLTRALSVGSAEDSAITSLVTAEAHGDTARAVSLIDSCAAQPACRARVAANASALKRAGSVSIIQIQRSAGFSLGATVGTARVAWLVGGSLPRVQCVRVRRAGNLLAGYTVKLERVSVRIKSDTACPRDY